MLTRTIACKDTQILMSRIVLGTGSFGTGISESDAFAQMDAYYAAGGRTIDTARVYGQWAIDGASEICIGKWLKDRGVRDEMVISTKGAHPPLHDITESRMTKDQMDADLADSLRFLQTDHVDLYFLHRDDATKPVSYIMDILHSYVESGRVRLLGASNWSVERIAEANAYAIAAGKTPFSVSQIEWSFARLNRQIYDDRDTTVFMTAHEYDWYSKNRFPVMAYSSQAKGLFSKLAASGLDALPESMKRSYVSPETLARYERAAALAAEHDVPVSQIALAALLHDPLQGCAIISASKPAQLVDSLAAADLTLSDSEYISLLGGETKCV